jgi:hypothetical protein
MITIALVIGCLQLRSGWVQSSKAQTAAATPFQVGLGDGSVRSIQPAIWAITSTQTFRACVSNAAPGDGDNDDLEAFAIFMRSPVSQVIERDLRVPVGEFRCTDVFPSDFIAAGAVPEATGRIQFQIDIVHTNEVASSNSAQESAVGSIETIETATGKTTVYQRLGSDRARVFVERVPLP